MIPDSPVYAHVSYVQDRTETTVAPGVTNEQLLLGISSLVAQLAVRVNATNGGVLPMDLIFNGLTQKVREIAPQLVHTVRQMTSPQEPGKAP